MIEELRELNFSKLIAVDFPDISKYSFNEYKKNNYNHKIKSFCTLCEEQGFNIAKDAPGFSLSNISHGAHTIDFIESTQRNKPDASGWHKESVLFVFESPSLDYDIYTTLDSNGYTKRPSAIWYWVERGLEYCQFPSYFKGREYNALVFSVINTFKLGNAYLTNLVKCGMNNAERQFRGIDYFLENCIKNCYNNFLSKEIQILEPKVIFTFGSKVDSILRKLLNKSIPVWNLPHPAGGQRGFKDDFFRALDFWIIAEGLYKAEIINRSELNNLLEVYMGTKV